jgi:1,5-anhydro-D-fructose reductase (1,5-anhydro-D-mannitol-forming)
VSKGVRIGIVGCGHITAAHLNGLRELREKDLLGGASVAALCDAALWKAESFRKRGEGPQQQPGAGPPGDPMQAPPVWVSDFQERLPGVYSDYREMLRQADVDTVFVLSSVFTHHEIGMAAIEAGKNVLIEKPFAVTVKAGKKLVEAARRKGVVIGVAECIRYAPNVRRIRWCIEQGYLGELQFTIYLSVGGFWAPDRIVAQTAWRHRKLTAAGGVAVDWMVHFYHWLRYTVGEIEEVSGAASTVEPVRLTRDREGKIVERVECETDDTLSCTIRYRNGALGSIMLSWAGHGEETSLPPIYYGSRGCIKGDQLILDGQKPRGLAELFEQNGDAEVKRRFMPAGIDNLFTLEILDFLSAIREGRQMETSGQEGVHDLACCFATLEAGARNRPIKVQDVLSGRVARFEAEINRHYRI